MKTTTITLVVPVIPNPLKKLNETRKAFKRAFLTEVMVAQHNRGNIVDAYMTHQKIRNI